MSHVPERDDPPGEAPAKPPPRIHPDIVKLGLVSFFTDLSSEMIFSVFAIFFTGIAGASNALLGLVEGLADFSASSLNYLAGWLSDRSGRRKAFTLAGYAFSTLAKTILLVSSSIAGSGVFRVMERLGKGFRGPPRDAWLSAVAERSTRGYAFGVHKALDKAGAVLGPLVAYALLSWLGDTPAAYRTVFQVALVPALVSVAVLMLVEDRPGASRRREDIGANWRALSPGFKRFLLPAGVFALAYYSLGFLLLRAHQAGFSVRDTVLLYVLFNATCVITAPLVGRLGDRIGRGRIVLLGYTLYGSINVALVFTSRPAAIVALFAAYGCFYAIDDSQGKAFIADVEPDRRASAIGIYNLVTGTLYLPASLVAGALWNRAPEWAFGLAGLLSGLAITAFVVVRPTATGPAAGEARM